MNQYWLDMGGRPQIYSNSNIATPEEYPKEAQAISMRS